MNRYLIKFSYLGTQYRGVQKNTIANININIYDPDTIQGVLESAFSTLNPKCITFPKIACSSRTDVGVHSFYNLGHIDLQNAYNSFYNPNEVLKYVNQYLINCKHDIRLLEFIPVKNDFRVRRLVKRRTYLYRFMRPKDNDNYKIPIMELRHCFHFRSDTFDPEKLKQATKLFMGLKDFRTFSAKSHSKREILYRRELNSLYLEKGTAFTPYDSLSQNFDFWNITCSAPSFLYKQVRRIVSCLLGISCGLITEKDVITMLQVPGHHNFLSCIPLVPPFGLYLANIEYHQEYLDKFIIKYKISPDDNSVIPLDENKI
ncbi:tRNA pseudouridine synthase-like 1 [Eufriesea mexicana]|uniref:tRNA pseudouridine synthase n=1 Tax=Eufriesea mexicana TaxID=516756 RepID=A0A310SRD1_9HYME|nr:PREDICTED: tRNA pseudouridine synthase-like 1 [Eufriesea mexicana]OAD57839.1 tRNA pseudouridine synthase-like 1 [Eufriesea mexicana]